MVQSTVYTLDLTAHQIPELKVPSLCEIWNWQGDTSVLPHKFQSVLNSCVNEHKVPSWDDDESDYFQHKTLKQQYLKWRGKNRWAIF